MKQILLLVGIAMMMSCKGNQTTQEQTYTQQSPDFNVDSAYTYIAEQCQFGPRIMNSAAHDSCGDYIARKFESFGATVYNQYADGRLYDGTPIKMRNIVASFDEANPVRLLICAHWDARPWADNDPNPDNYYTPIDGANDGGSGVGVMMEIARQIQLKAPAVGVDFICFDAEDCGVPNWENSFDDTSSSWCLGSQYWAGTHHIEGYRARFGILLDMVGGSNCNFQKEAYSVLYAGQFVDKVWAKAQNLGFGEYFSSEKCGAVTDDHVQVNQSGIPCIDIISHDKNGYGFCATHHTVDDNLAHINKQTLHAVGQTVMEVIYTEQQ